MSASCPHCKRPYLEPPDDTLPQLDRVAMLRHACALMGIRPSWDGYVSEAAAARLLNRSLKTIRNRRHAEGGIPYRKGAGRNGRVEYSLADLAVARADHQSEGEF